MKKILFAFAGALLCCGTMAAGRYAKQLSAHKIDTVYAVKATLNYPRQVGKNSHRDVHGMGNTVNIWVVRTDRGAQGIGMGPGGGRDDAVRRLAALKGKAVGEIFSVEDGVSDGTAKGLDMALYDLTGVITGKRVCELWGKPAEKRVKIYSGMIYMDDLEKPTAREGIAAVMENCKWDYDYGYRQFKLKIGRSYKWMPHDEGLQRDIEITRLIARNFPDVDILVDMNDGYTFDDLTAYLTALEGIPVWWIEEPFQESTSGFARLRAWLDANGRSQTLLADGEVRPDIDSLLAMGRAGALEVVLPDIMDYGFAKWVKLMPRLKEAGLSASPHNWGNLLKTFYTAHLALAFGGVCTIEGVTCTSDQLDFGGTYIKDGYFIPSSRPGFGITLK